MSAVLRLLLGDMAQLLLASQNVTPRRAVESGFRFEFEDLAAAFADIVTSTDRRPADEQTLDANYECPVCSAEMRRYESDAKACGASLRFVAVTDAAAVAVRYGLTVRDMQRRFFLESAGRMYSGIEAFAHIWRQLPAFRWLAALVSLPIVNVAAAALYDMVLAPALTRWNEARHAAQIRATAVVG